MRTQSVGRVVLAASTAMLGIAVLVGSASAEPQAAPQAVPTPAPAKPAVAPAPEQAQAAALFEKSCSGCHELAQATTQSMDKAGWHDTVQQMIGYGAAITPAEADRIADYLAGKYGAKPGS